MKYTDLEKYKQVEPTSLSPRYDYVVGWNAAIDFVIDMLLEENPSEVETPAPEIPKPDMSLVKTIYEYEDEACYEYRGDTIYWNIMGEGEYTIGDWWYNSLEDACKAVEASIVWNDQKEVK